MRSNGIKPEVLLLTVEDVAHALQICRTNTFHLIRTGEIKSVKIGRSRRITRDAVDDFVRRLADEAMPHR